MTITADTLTDQKLADMTPLARARACTPLSIREVASAVGIGYGMLSEYESGAKTPRPATQQKLADFYGVDMAYLFDTTPPRRAEARQPDPQPICDPERGAEAGFVEGR